MELGRVGDLGAWNSGLLILVTGRERAEYVQWADVGRIEFDR